MLIKSCSRGKVDARDVDLGVGGQNAVCLRGKLVLRVLRGGGVFFFKEVRCLRVVV